MDTVPQQPVAKPPIKKTMPIVLVLLGAVVLIGVSTAYNALTSSNHKKEAAKSTLQTRPATADPQQVTGFREATAALIAKNDAEQAQLQQAIAALQAQDHGIPAPEADPSMPMTAAQSSGDLWRRPQRSATDFRPGGSAWRKPSRRQRSVKNGAWTRSIAIPSPSISRPTRAEPSRSHATVRPGVLDHC